MAEEAERRHNPFQDFINFSLDMQGIDGISFETVALAMRDVIRNLPTEENGTMWSDQLDRLQATLRMCLSIETIGRLTKDNPQFAEMDAENLELVVTLAISLAFVCYNQLVERFDFEPAALTQSRDETKQLWTALRAASGWVNKAAASGDDIAKGMSGDITRLLEDITPRGWNNNTRIL